MAEKSVEQEARETHNKWFGGVVVVVINGLVALIAELNGFQWSDLPLSVKILSVMVVSGLSYWGFIQFEELFNRRWIIPARRYHEFLGSEDIIIELRHCFFYHEHGNFLWLIFKVTNQGPQTSLDDWDIEVVPRIENANLNIPPRYRFYQPDNQTAVYVSKDYLIDRHTQTPIPKGDHRYGIQPVSVERENITGNVRVTARCRDAYGRFTEEPFEVRPDKRNSWPSVSGIEPDEIVYEPEEN